MERNPIHEELKIAHTRATPQYALGTGNYNPYLDMFKYMLPLGRLSYGIWIEPI